MKECLLSIVIGSMLVSAGVALVRDYYALYFVLVVVAIYLHDRLFCLKNDEPKGGEYDGIES